MRVLTLSALLALAAIGTTGHAQVTERGTILMNAVDWYRTITMSKDGAVIASVSVSPGTFVSVIYDRQKNQLPNQLLGSVTTLHGDVDVHALSRAQYDQKEKINDALLASPITFSSSDVDVTVTDIAKP
jgi:hypothetical protein